MLAAELFWGLLVMSPMITTPPFCGTSIFGCLPHLWGRSNSKRNRDIFGFALRMVSITGFPLPSLSYASEPW